MIFAKDFVQFLTVRGPAMSTPAAASMIEAPPDGTDEPVTKSPDLLEEVRT